MAVAAGHVWVDRLAESSSAGLSHGSGRPAAMPSLAAYRIVAVRCTLGRLGARAGFGRDRPTMRDGVYARDPKPRRPGPGPGEGPVGRPSFGVGPIARVMPSPLAARAATQAPAMPAMPRGGFGLPSLRRNVCQHFYMTGSRGAIPIQAPHLLKGLIRQDSTISRCQLRGGVHLEQGYVNDVCLTPRFNQCVFYEEELTRE